MHLYSIPTVTNFTTCALLRLAQRESGGWRKAPLQTWMPAIECGASACSEMLRCGTMAQVGTAVVTRHTDNRLALGRLGALVEQLHALVRSGRQVILVTSGAVCVGRQVLRQQHILNSSPLQMMGNHNFCGDAPQQSGPS